MLQHSSVSNGFHPLQTATYARSNKSDLFPLYGENFKVENTWMVAIGGVHFEESTRLLDRLSRNITV